MVDMPLLPFEIESGEPDRSRPAARVFILLLRRKDTDYLPLTMPSIQSLMVPDTEAQ